MIAPITRSVTEAAVAQPREGPATAAPVRQAVAIVPATDTVKLSADAKIHLLQSQGQTIDQIAVGLNLSPQLVASYLGTTPLQLQALSSIK